MAVRFRIVGTELPGATCGPAPTETGRYDNIHLGIQRRQEVIGLVRGDAPEAGFEFDAAVKDGQFRGSFIHGRSGQRFIYLSWGELVDGELRMFRRAKLHLEHLDAAQAEGRTIRGSLTLTDAKGHPLCAAVRPPRVTWTVV